MPETKNEYEGNCFKWFFPSVDCIICPDFGKCLEKYSRK